jgi:hypothetical protein
VGLGPASLTMAWAAAVRYRAGRLLCWSHTACICNRHGASNPQNVQAAVDFLNNPRIQGGEPPSFSRNGKGSHVAQVSQGVRHLLASTTKEAQEGYLREKLTLTGA